LPICDKLKIKNFNSLNLKCMQDQINKTKLFIGMDLHKNTSTFCVKDKECSYYNGLKKRKGSKTAAVATARKLLAVVWRLLKDNRPYEACDPRCRKSGRIALNLSSS